MSDRGTVVFIVAPGLGSTAAIINISFDAPSNCVGGQAGFSNVPPATSGDPYSAVVNFLPAAASASAVQIAGLYESCIVWALVNVPTGSTISGSVQVEQPLTHDLKIQTFTGGNFTLPAGQTSGTFSFPFDGSQTLSASAKSMTPSVNA